MLRSHRHIILAAFGWLIFVSASPPPKGGEGKSERPSSGSNQSFEKIALSLQKANEANQPDTGCDKGKDNRESDLCAQWKAADAGYESTIWTGRTFWLTLGGLVIGALTLVAAGFAAWYARRAAEETKRTADLTEEAQRAWIHNTEVQKGTAKNCYIDGQLVNNGILLRCAWKNVGISPAFGVGSIADYRIFEKDEPIEHIFSAPPYVKAGSITIGPGGEMTSAPFMFNDSVSDAIRGNRVKVVIYVKVYYFPNMKCLLANDVRYSEMCAEVTHGGGSETVGGVRHEAISTHGYGVQNTAT